MKPSNTIENANGKWTGILMELGVPRAMLVNRHGPCPTCEGKDRFRYDNKEGNGTSFCNVCGARSGYGLAKDYSGMESGPLLNRIDEMLGNKNMTTEMGTKKMDDQKAYEGQRNIWKSSVKITPETKAHKYFEGRGIGQLVYPRNLRLVESAPDGCGGLCPAIIARVGLSDDKSGNQIHRTFLTADGSSKAEMKSPRKIMPGSMVKGSSIQLSEYTGGTLGIAEGIETAMSASELYGIPVWAAINANVLAEWIPPASCRDVAIFGDNDKSFTGQAAAYTLAKRLTQTGRTTTVHIPRNINEDWNDVWQLEGKNYSFNQ
jgi:putative DNA primase/helicase